MRTVGAIPAIGLAAGCVFGLFGPAVSKGPGSVVLLACAAVAAGAWLRSRALGLALAVGAAFFVGGGLLAADAWHKAWRPPLRVAFEDLARAERARSGADHRLSPADDEAFAMVSGRLRADAAPTGSGVSLSVDVDSLSARGSREAPEGSEAAGGILVTVVGTLAGARMDEWRAGRRVRLPVRLRRPARYLDPGVPDEEQALARRGTTLVGTVKSGALVEVLAHGRWWDERAADVRAFARRTIGNAVGSWSRHSSAIVAAIVIGDRAGLDRDVERRLQEAGTYHVIAISGGNIALLAGLMLAAFRWAGLPGRGATLAAIVWLVAYARLVGGGASVERATVMAVVYLAGRFLDHRSPPLNTLWIVAVILLAVDPLSVADPALVLTCGATLAILAVRPVVPHGVQPAALKPLVTMLVASLAAEAMLFPVGARVFSRVTFAGLVLNLLAIPLMAIVQVAGMAVLPVALVSSRLAAAPGAVAHLAATGLVWSADLASWLPVLSRRVAPPAWTSVSVYYAGVAVAWMLWRRRTTASGSSEPLWCACARRTAAAVSAAAAVWMLAEPWALRAARGDGRLHVTFLDVGQGDSVFIRFPHGATMLVDAGGLAFSSSFDVGDRVVAPVLRQSGLRRLTYLVLTHGDPDHIGGAMSILREFRPREVWEGIPVPAAPRLAALRAQAEASGGRWVHAYGGDRAFIDGVEVAVRHPMPADWERRRVRNDDSVVIELGWGDASVLLTGDIGVAAERVLADGIVASPLRVIKVPHHGGLTSSSVEFLRAAGPRVAVFSAGRDNHFGHPAPAVLARYRAAGAAIFRTDQDGAVNMETDGYRLTVRTFAGRIASYEPRRPPRARR